MECGDCTLCCVLFPVNWLNKPANVKCIHCDGGCKIHMTKPAECSDFNCAYVQSPDVTINARPDKCGIIFEKLSERLFLGTVAVETEVSDVGKRQIESFLDQGYSVVLVSPKKFINKYFINKRHKVKHIKKELNKKISKKYGHLWN